MPKISYDHQLVEEKWLKYWQDIALFQDTDLDLSASELAKKSYLLFAFAYPSGSGLHVGHVESKTALDILQVSADAWSWVFSRLVGMLLVCQLRIAIKTGIHPSQTTKTAIDTAGKSAWRSPMIQ